MSKSRDIGNMIFLHTEGRRYVLTIDYNMDRCEWLEINSDFDSNIIEGAILDKFTLDGMIDNLQFRVIGSNRTIPENGKNYDIVIHKVSIEESNTISIDVESKLLLKKEEIKKALSKLSDHDKIVLGISETNLLDNVK